MNWGKTMGSQSGEGRKGDDLTAFVRRHFELQRSAAKNEANPVAADLKNESDRERHLSPVEARLLTLRQAGLEREDGPGPADWDPAIGDGFEASLQRAIFGWTKPEYQRTWEGRAGSTGISTADFQKAYNAVAFANRTGTVMNVHATLVWSTVGQTNGIATAKIAGLFLERFRKWSHERDLPCRWVHVLEISKKNGLHSHVLMHVPRVFELDFRKWVRRCIGTLTGKTPVPRVTPGLARKLHIAKPNHTANLEVSAETDIRAQWEVFTYLMKGILPAAYARDADDRRKARPLLDVAGIPEKYRRRQGEVLTKRVSVARDIDRASQARVGFRSAYDDGARDPGGLYVTDYLKSYERDREYEKMLQNIGQLEI
ncbi:hypothetical protein [Rhodoplanes azumiensis]|uniref:Uncharacterized protein n=1 Tax=Rhodoplanes azumiensis TaxID=1897628 RepID=A0ABW5AFL9_9BRAD